MSSAVLLRNYHLSHLPLHPATPTSFSFLAFSFIFPSSFFFFSLSFPLLMPLHQVYLPRSLPFAAPVHAAPFFIFTSLPLVERAGHWHNERRVVSTYPVHVVSRIPDFPVQSAATDYKRSGCPWYRESLFQMARLIYNETERMVSRGSDTFPSYLMVLG